MNAAYRLAAKLFHLLPLPSGKLAESRRGRLAAGGRWVDWARDSRTECPLVWFHAASVGESQVIAPIAARLRERHRSLQTVLTFSSPSMSAWPGPPGVDRIDYAPADLPSAVAAVFNSLRPSIIVVSRGDLWPEMVHGALARHVPVAVVGGAVGRGSNRLRWPIRQLLATVHRRLAFVGARSAEDASRWIRLGARQEVVHVTGDPRNDYILDRVPGKSVPQPLAAWGSAGHVMVAGSTHPQDEELLIDAFAVIASRDKAARLLVVPHEPGPASVRRIVSRARRLRLEAALWNGSPAEIRAPIVVVDQAGLLGDLYAVGALAYVGGGFGTSGVHSLAEPAAWGVPVLAGPGVFRDAAAQPLLESGGVTAISGPDPLPELVEKWTRWLGDPDARSAAGRAARAQIRCGAADESVQALERLLGIVAGKD